MRPRSLLLGLLVVAAAHAQQTVDAVRVVARAIDRKVSIPGEIVPYERVAIYGKVAGFVDSVLVDRGSRVQKGQLLASVIAPEFKAQRAEAVAKAESAESEIASAKARAAASRSTFERIKSASATPGAIAGNELVQAEQEVAAEDARVQAAVASAGAARAAVEAVEEMEGYLRITAPFSGVITERVANPGALTGGQAAPLFQLEQNSRLRVVAAVPEIYAGAVSNGAKVTFRVPAYPGQTFTATVARTAHSLDSKTRTMAVELDFANAAGRLAPGMYPSIDWPVRRDKPALAVPPTSVVTTTERVFVNRLRNGVVEWVTVSRGAATGDLVEVSGPLQPGDLIARRGTDELREGTKVQPQVK